MNSDPSPGLTFVVPALDEAESLPQLFDEIREAARVVDRTFEVIVVDDGSTDGTVDAVRSARAEDPRIRLLSFSRNFGKAAAYTAAFQRARGEVVVTMDADLQDDPAELAKLLAELEGQDVVVGWKIARMGNEPTKTLPSRVFNAMNRLVFGIAFRDQNSGYRVMRREVARTLELSGDNYRFIPQLAHLAGFRVGETGVVHRKRVHGVSKYGVTRFWTGLLDLLTVGFLARFRHRPLHFFGTAGLLPIAIGVGLLLYVLAMKLLGDTFQEHVAAMIIGVTSLLIGFQSVLIGLVAELLAAPRGDRYILGPDSTDA
ncbi:MAG: glycosyltransferase family 2 protein [Myxococcota bacterium]